MRIRTLDTLPFESLVDTILRAFEGYFVPMPADPAYWQDRFHSAHVDLARSYGAFEGQELVAFIIQGFGDLDGARTAYNSGTGVLPAYRGRQLVDALYAHAIPLLKDEGVAMCSLEVIERNTITLRVYERIGFAVHHRLKCFKGTLQATADPDGPALVPGDLHATDLGDDRWYSWDHRAVALRRSQGRQQLYTLGGDAPIGHVVLDPGTGRIARLSVTDEDDGRQWQRLLSAMATVKPDVVLVNVHPDRTTLIHALLSAGLVNHIDQFEMRMALGR